MGEAYTVMPLSPIRKVIAARMIEANQTVPHFRLCADIEIDALLGLRAELRDHRPDEKLSLNDFLIKGCAAALMDTPAINIQWVDGAIHRYHTADISVITALEDGISTPILRRAECKSIWEISREVKELTGRAARSLLTVDEVFGGSFSISNLGMYGVDQFDAIINPPQCAILAVGVAKPRLVASPSGETATATVVRVTLSLDHRALDGAIGAAFLSTLRTGLEHPDELYFTGGES
jgi:pyruvate dehydrogenase E2 component (dihydrolipoamide acetyltransferase)